MRQLIGLTLLAVIFLSSCTENEMTFDDTAIAEENQTNEFSEITKKGIWIPAEDLKGKFEKGLDPFYYYSSSEDDDPQIIVVQNSDYAAKIEYDKHLKNWDNGDITCSGEGSTCAIRAFDGGIIVLVPEGDEAR